MVGFVNSIVGRFSDILLFPFRGLDPWVGMVAVSLLTALMMLLVYRLSSNQQAIREVKDRIMAHLLELRLYRDSLPVTFGAQGRILLCNFKYVGYSLKPMLVMIVPLVLLILQLDLWFGYRPLKAGESAIVKVRVKEGVLPSGNEIALEPGAGFVIETPPLRIDQERELNWRIRAAESGSWELNIRANGQTMSKRLVVGAIPLSKVSPAKSGANWVDLLLNPGEGAIPVSPVVERIEIQYPEAAFFGGHVHWLIVFFTLSVLLGFALKGAFKVEV